MKYYAVRVKFVNTSTLLMKVAYVCMKLIISKEIFSKLIETVPEFRDVYNQFMEFAFIHSQMRIYSFLGMEGIDKLRWVMEHEPKLLTHISSKAIASYLGMTNSTLSKLRAQL